MGPYDLFADWSNRAWPLVANHLWQSTLFALLALCAAASLRRAPAVTRYLVWLIALFKFALPSALIFFLAAQAGFDLSSLSLRRYHSESSTINVSPLLSPVTSPAPAARAAEPLASGPGATGSVTAEARPEAGGGVYGALTCLWLAGCGVLGLSWLRKSRGLSAALKRGRELTRGREAEALRSVRAWFGMGREVRLVVTPAVSEPGVWGVWRPVVLLPEGVAERLDDGELEAVFMHELSHVERWDNLAGIFQRALCCLFWFHPVVWMIGRRLLSEREQACDDVVVRRGGASEVYANGIAKVCRYCLGWEVAGLAKATGSDLRQRIERIISNRAGQRMSAAQAATLAALTAGVLTLSLASGEGGIARPAFPLDERGAVIDSRFEVIPSSSPRQAANAAGRPSLHDNLGPRVEAVTPPSHSQEPADLILPPAATTFATALAPAVAEISSKPVEIQPTTRSADTAPPEPPPAQTVQSNRSANLKLTDEPPPAPAADTVGAAVVNAASADYGSLRKFIGRYEVDPQRRENFILDITLEDGGLWLKPSHAARRRLIRQSETDFTDSYNDYNFTAIPDDGGRVVGLRLNSWGRNVTARRLALPQPSLRGNVTFRLRGFANAKVVAVAGDFNKWNQSQFIFAREGGEWVCRVSLPEGTYQYKFIVDGNWLTDPNNPQSVHDRRGFENSLLKAE
jgi:beta-lactamase regulating signal transducer with metallopeptidase domain